MTDTGRKEEKDWIPNTVGWVVGNWEKSLFRIFGLGLLGYSAFALKNSNMTEFASVSAIAVFCFIYANFTKFRKFKGLGFEAELWEDKQAEAAKLVDQLKEIVAIYTRETLMAKVFHGRLYSSSTEKTRWVGIWKLYDQLVDEHSRLGQKIDFDEIKRDLETHFIFDAMIPTYREIERQVSIGHQKAGEKIGEEFGHPIKDAEGYSKRIQQHRAIKTELGDPYELVKERNLSERLLTWFEAERQILKAHFDVEISLDEETQQRLEFFREIEPLDALEITDELIEKFAGLASKRL